ncbi:MAG: PHP domain-containing protein [Firmicutes bacterium]|nr:PHP domain-containing protein [Bacillota bacterium]
MTIVADLHVHTTASDGLYSPEEVVKLAARKGLQALAVTDHDTVDGIKEAQLTGEKVGIEVWPGIELSTEYEDSEIHLLGFGIDPDAVSLFTLLSRLRESRFERTEKIVAVLKKMDYQITMEEILQEAGNAAPGRAHIARLLVKKGYRKNVPEVFATLLDKGQPAYVKRYKITPQEAIATIRAAGGAACWAHPGLAKKDHLLALFIKYGLHGIEVFHPDHSNAAEKKYLSLAQEPGLLITGGSDFHGKEMGSARDLGASGLNAARYQSFKKFMHKIKRI